MATNSFKDEDIKKYLTDNLKIVIVHSSMQNTKMIIKLKLDDKEIHRATVDLHDIL